MGEPRTGIVITGWSAVSRFGIGRAAFADGIRHGRTPDDRGVPDFDPRAALGKKNTRSMDRATGLALVALRELETTPADTTGVVLGTTLGSVPDMVDFTRASLTGARPFHVNPGQFPNVVMNRTAAQCAIWYGLKGPNATVATGQVAGLSALAYARRVLAAGRAGQMVCGAAEARTDARSWLASNREGDSRQPHGEGAVMLMVCQDEALPPLARVVAVESRVCRDGDIRGALAGCVTDMLARADVRPEEITRIEPSAGHHPEQERDCLRALLGDSRISPLSTVDRLGDTGAVSALFQIGSALTAPGTVLITSVERDGIVACALLTINHR
ncbi:beta-ketoacyl synthase N-terminal-like domain-containing protein [Kibdelosporangium aridum]|uniref:beta-ketoacyl synthase N-terminal-like domain-containing protein n=1 Tax=Kibdelosporangium aridum TaxID=2030 RepID=UPI0035E6E0EE